MTYFLTGLIIAIIILVALVWYFVRNEARKYETETKSSFAKSFGGTKEEFVGIVVK